MRKHSILVPLVFFAVASFGLNAAESAPYALSWKATATERSVMFELSVVEATTGQIVMSPRINTQTSFQITSDPEKVPGTTFILSGKPLGDGRWALTLKALRDSSVIQETRYTATLP